MIIDALAVIGTVAAAGGILALLFVTIRSKLPQETIKVQNDAISALERQNTMLKEEIVKAAEERTMQIDRLTEVVKGLQSRVEILETIPLATMADTMKQIAGYLEELKSIGTTNQALMQSLASSTTIITNK